MLSTSVCQHLALGHLASLAGSAHLQLKWPGGEIAWSGVSPYSSFSLWAHQCRRSRKSCVRLSFSATVVSWAIHPTNSHEKRQTSLYDASPGGKDTWTVFEG